MMLVSLRRRRRRRAALCLGDRGLSPGHGRQQIGTKSRWPFPRLEYAAERGVLGAQLKLARIYAAGNGVPQGRCQGLFLLSPDRQQRADISPSSPVAKYVAEAFVALGQYYLEGIPAPRSCCRIPHAPPDLFRHAASYFGDADAQYALAGLYLTGTGVEKNMGLAVNWLATAAKKQHAEAQAKLGELLWRGGDEIRQHPQRGSR